MKMLKLKLSNYINIIHVETKKLYILSSLGSIKLSNNLNILNELKKNILWLRNKWLSNNLNSLSIFFFTTFDIKYDLSSNLLLYFMLFMWLCIFTAHIVLKDKSKEKDFSDRTQILLIDNFWLYINYILTFFICILCLFWKWLVNFSNNKQGVFENLYIYTFSRKSYLLESDLISSQLFGLSGYLILESFIILLIFNIFFYLVISLNIKFNISVLNHPKLANITNYLILFNYIVFIIFVIFAIIMFFFMIIYIVTLISFLLLNIDHIKLFDEFTIYKLETQYSKKVHIMKQLDIIKPIIWNINKTYNVDFDFLIDYRTSKKLYSYWSLSDIDKEIHNELMIQLSDYHESRKTSYYCNWLKCFYDFSYWITWLVIDCYVLSNYLNSWMILDYNLFLDNFDGWPNGYPDID